jgi:hypothetical protein
MERRWFLPALLVLNASALLAFRHFVSLDGPMHLLHASVLRDALSGKVRGAEGMWVDTGSLDLNLGDLLLIGLSGVVHPFILHKLIAALAVTCVCAGAWRLTRAYGKDVNAAWLLVLPFAIGFVLVLGFFHFIIAAGIALGLCGWWVSRPSVHWRELVLLVLGCAMGTFAHKAGGAMLLLLIGIHEAVLRISDPIAWRAHWSGLPLRLPTALAALGAVLGIAVLAMRFSTSPVHPHEEHRPLEEMLTMRPMLLLDSVGELPFRIALGAALVVLMASALWFRRRTKALKPSDALLINAVLLLLASLIRTPRTELLYITDRAQWLALLLIACWLGVQTMPAKLMRVTLFGLLALHSLRLALVERRMNDVGHLDEAALDASRYFEPGALVVPVVLDDHWLARHRTAYAAIGHDGIIFTGRDHLRFGWKTPPDVYVRTYITSPENNWGWIGTHIRKGIAPELRQVLVLGEVDNAALQPWNELLRTLEHDYVLSSDQGYARVWTRKTRFR